MPETPLWVLPAPVEQVQTPRAGTPSVLTAAVVHDTAVRDAAGAQLVARRSEMLGVRSLCRRLTLLIVLVVGAGLPPLSADPARAGDERPAGLTVSQERVVLRLIDNVCGDTWCEGDYAFRFRRFSCEPAKPSCTLALKIAPYTSDPPRWRSRSGELKGFARYSQLVTLSPTGHQSLTETFYQSLTALITGIEASVPAARALP